MGLIQWKKEYEIGVAELDNQHKRIIKILNQLIEQRVAGKDEKEIGRLLDDLQDYIREHFRTEEEYMLKHQYAGYEEQRKAHNQFIDRLFEAQKEYFKHGRLTSINLLNFVWDWFSQHILKYDKLIGSVNK